MSYQFLDINLLPPELLPGPAVRYRVIIIWALVLITLALIMLDSFLGFARIGQRRDTRDVLGEQVEKQQYIVNEYLALMKVEHYVMKTGKLVSLASADYLDLPLAANRIAHLLPDGVFLERITNNRPGKGSNISDVAVILVASRDDPMLVLETFNRFKEDPMFSNSFMRIAEREQRSLNSLLSGANIRWMVNGPELPTEVTADHYLFEIHSLVESPIANDDFKVIYDDSQYLANFERRMAEEDATAAEGQDDPVSDVLGPPEGVTVEATN